MKRVKWLRFLMIITIIAIACFQFYWLRQSYEREKTALQIKTDFAFRESIMQLQMEKINLESISLGDSGKNFNIMLRNDGGPVTIPMNRREGMISNINVVRDKVRKTSVNPGEGTIVSLTKSTVTPAGDTFQYRRMGRTTHIFNLLSGVDSLQDSITAAEIDTVFATMIQRQGTDVPYTIIGTPGADVHDEGGRELTVGFKNPVTYRLELGNTVPYLLGEIKLPILFSILLLGITVITFYLLYKNVLRQQRLNMLKNDFISNITHELKTPLATVGVAIEALRNFNAIEDPRRTQEYLDISSNELQRLNLLVDKVLKLSMFERQELRLNFESVDFKELVNEVVTSFRLQLEKYGATLDVNHAGDTVVRGDRLHLTSIIFNLLDNALKYRSGTPVISIDVEGDHDSVRFAVADNGIGIPKEFQQKIFEKFFRVPHGNTHDVKGYGLGLSYTAQVIQNHNGLVNVESSEAGGTTITIKIPKTQP